MKLKPGLYDSLTSRQLSAALREIDPAAIELDDLEEGDSARFLGRYVGWILVKALEGVGGPDRVANQVELCNRLLEDLARRSKSVQAAESLAHPIRRLLAVADAGMNLPGERRFPRRPEVPLAESALLVNGRDQPSIASELKRELESADAVDLLCAFVKWHGFRILAPQLEELTRRGRRLRVLTTTYMGATDRRALDALVALGAEVRVCYESGRTRLHAKAWLFHRETGFSTAYVGSSNMSRSALVDGLEWNVRLSSVAQAHLLETFRATFEEYWEDPIFEPYHPERDRERFDCAVGRERFGNQPAVAVSGLQVEPWPHQREMLDALEVERELHQRRRNLVVSATGTGKTVLSGLDYDRLRTNRQAETLLFVAHREEILDQSLRTFREIVRDGSFGEKFVAGHRPSEWRHVFASIQSLSQLELARLGPADRFDMVVVDEFHHAEAPTYQRLLEYLEPKVLLGLTATPERTDGQDVTRWFDGRIAVELRLWQALDEGLLCPFHYFGLHDDVDLGQARWSRGGYELAGLSGIYTGHDARAQKIHQAIRNKVGDPRAMRALGFCVSVEHAEFMAERFSAWGLPSRALSAQSSREQRRQGLEDLRDGRINVLFAVDLFNEGLDLPDIDTVLFLRPTESATLFLQQLGRGLRKAHDKPCLTALDFIGHQHANFRFDRKYQAIYRRSRREIESEIREGFPHLPAGCHMELDRVAAEIVLDNVQRALRLGWPGLAAELRALGDVSLAKFLRETQVDLEDLYRSKRGGWTSLRRAAGTSSGPAGPHDQELAAGLARILHLDDDERLGAYRELVDAAAPPGTAATDTRRRRLLAMLHFDLWGAAEPLENQPAALARLWENDDRRREFRQLLEILAERRHRRTWPLDPKANVPLHLHATYRRDEIVAAFGLINPGSLRQGVRWVSDESSDFFLVTLRKTERHFSPSTRYQDRAISPTMFQWESQSTTSEASPTGQRYILHAARGSSVHLFVREAKHDALGAMPFFYAGRAWYQGHEGELPMRIRWRLETPLPTDVFDQMRIAAG